MTGEKVSRHITRAELSSVGVGVQSYVSGTHLWMTSQWISKHTLAVFSAPIVLLIVISHPYRQMPDFQTDWGFYLLFQNTFMCSANNFKKLCQLL